MCFDLFFWVHVRKKCSYDIITVDLFVSPPLPQASEFS